MIVDEWRIINIDRNPEGEPPLICILRNGKLFGVIDFKPGYIEDFYDVFIVGFNPKDGKPVMYSGSITAHALEAFDDTRTVLRLLENPENIDYVRKIYKPKPDTVRKHLRKYMDKYLKQHNITKSH